MVMPAVVPTMVVVVMAKQTMPMVVVVSMMVMMMSVWFSTSFHQLGDIPGDI